MRIMGIDYGTKRIGTALSDESRTFAREYRIFSPGEFWKEIEGVVAKEEITHFVIGLPLNMSGEHTDKTREAEKFSLRLETQLKLPIEFMDERLSSVMAGHLPGGKKDVDSLAAQIILQNYLDKSKH
jgi:putative holliday junction resolvase